jgi:hypothetical protein
MIRGVYQENKLYHDGAEIPLVRSRKVRDHSPTGFNWNYLGSGPSQAALALLLEFGATDEEALSFYQEFKREVIANLPPTDFEMQDSVVLDWLAARRIFAREFHDE